MQTKVQDVQRREREPRKKETSYRKPPTIIMLLTDSWYRRERFTTRASALNANDKSHVGSWTSVPSGSKKPFTHRPTLDAVRCCWSETHDGVNGPPRPVALRSPSPKSIAALLALSLTSVRSDCVLCPSSFGRWPAGAAISRVCTV